MQVNRRMTSPDKVKPNRCRPTVGNNILDAEKMMQAFDVMTSSVISVTPETTVRDAAKLLVQHRISAMPVLDGDGDLVGMVSEGDLLHRAEIETEKSHRSWWLDLLGSDREAADYVKSHGQTVADVMTRQAVCVADVTPLHEVASILESHHIKRVPVMRDGRLVGIVSRANLVQALAVGAQDPAQYESPSDRDIRAMLMAELTGRNWAFPGRNIVVRDGVVHLWGPVWSTDSLNAMCVAAQGIPGVKGVEDHTIPYPIMPGI
jgi:CBS domain-containing protein